MNHISKALRGVADKYNGVSLIIRIIVGLIAGTALALVVPHMTWIGEFGTLFVSALKAVAPILVFVLVASALAQGNSKLDGRFGTVLFLYLFHHVPVRRRGGADVSHVPADHIVGRCR